MATTQLGDNTVNTVGELPAVGSQAPGWDLVGLKFQPVTDAESPIIRQARRHRDGAVQDDDQGSPASRQSISPHCR